MIGSIIALLGLDLAVPDHTTLSRRTESLDVVCPRPGSGPVHLLVDSTGPNSAAPANSCSRSTERRHGGRGVSCTSRGCRHQTDSSGGADHQRCLRCLSGRRFARSGRWPSRFVHCRRCLRLRGRL
ncbi:transposase [Acidisphaera sp. L21]|uniref:transposase n=1 Tax=Acidisphaera sp. L21 TaxID=1641851 RepID=UPI001C202433